MKIFVPDASADFCVQTLSAQKCRSPQAQTAGPPQAQACFARAEACTRAGCAARIGRSVDLLRRP